MRKSLPIGPQEQQAKARHNTAILLFSFLPDAKSLWISQIWIGYQKLPKGDKLVCFFLIYAGLVYAILVFDLYTDRSSETHAKCPRSGLLSSQISLSGVAGTRDWHDLTYKILELECAEQECTRLKNITSNSERNHQHRRELGKRFESLFAVGQNRILLLRSGNQIIPNCPDTPNSLSLG